MALSIIDEPYAWALRGQKLMVIASSTETAQNGFRYGVEVNIDGKLYNFYVPASPDDNLYFDLAPLLDDMRNYEPLGYHFSTDDTQDDGSKRFVNITLSEWWMVGGVLTQAEGSAVVLDEKLVVNGYFQVIDGYKPNVLTGSQKVKQSLTNNTSLAMSDRKTDTHVFKLAQTWGFAAVPNSTSTWIPAYESDYGLLCIPGNDLYLNNNDALNMQINIFSATGVPSSPTTTMSTTTTKNNSTTTTPTTTMSTTTTKIISDHSNHKIITTAVNNNNIKKQ